MQVTREQIDPCTVKLDIQVEKEAVDHAYDRAYREFSRFTAVPGFRSGKAPRAVLENFVNQERLLERVRELAAVPAYKEALEQEDIKPFGDPEVEFSDLTEGQPWQFQATVATPPQVELGDYNSIEVERKQFPVTDEEVEQAILRIRGEHARIQRIDDRGVEAGDILICEVQITPEGQEPAEEPQRKLIRLGNNIPGFDEAVLGMKPEEERNFELTYPEDYQDKELAGKQAMFQLKLLNINHEVLPELTDEWVKGVTASPSVDDLRASVRESLEGSMQKMADQLVYARIIDELVSRSTIQYPEVMAREEMQEDAQGLAQEMQKHGVTYEQYLQQAGQTEQQHREQMRSRADARIRKMLALRELANKEKLTASPSEIDEAFQAAFDEDDTKPRDRAKFLSDPERRTAVANAIVERKLRDFLTSVAQIKDTAPQS